MPTLKEVLKNVDAKVTSEKPDTMDKLIDTVHSVYGMQNYGSQFKIVEYMGYLQGVRVFITGRKNTYQLPAKNKVYSVFKGIDKYKKAGYPVIND